MLMMTLIVQIENVSDNWKYRRFYLMVVKKNLKYYENDI